MDINKIILVGRLAQNIDYHPPKNGAPARAVGTLVVNRDANGSGKKENDVFQIVAWDKKAQVMLNHTCKGKELGIEGSLRSNQVWIEKLGRNITYYEVLVHRISLGVDPGRAKIIDTLNAGVPLNSKESPVVSKDIKAVLAKFAEKGKKAKNPFVKKE